MSDNVYFVVDMQEIERKDYYEARKDKRMLVLEKPFGFIWSRGAQRFLYLTANGKFYAGPLDLEQTYRDLEDAFEFLGVELRAPQAVFKRKPAPDKSKAA